MSWSIEEHIGDCRPFPAQVIVYKGETDERMAYVSGEVADRLKAENAKLRELVNGMRYCANEAYGMCARVPVGGERPFTCCPLYDFDTKEYRCEKLMYELGIEVE